MEYRRLGQCGLRVSALSIGGWLTIGKSIDASASREILHRAIDAGINFIDVADIYATGESERVTGEALKGFRRSDLVISSKVFWPMSDNPNDRGLSRKHIMESIDKSLQRLQTSYLDLYFCHRFDDQTPLLETMRAMDDLVRQGKVLYWGTSMWTGEQLRQAHALAERHNLHAPVVEQPRYNLIHREIEREVLPTCQKLGMGLTIWSPLAQGLLTGKYNAGIPEGSRAAQSTWLAEDLTEQNLRRVRALSALAEEAGALPEHLALAWALNQDAVSSVITGATSLAQLEHNLAAARFTPSSDLLAGVQAIFA